MSEQNTNNQINEQSVEEQKDVYLSALEEMKKTHVPKSRVTDLENENKRLVGMIVNGESMPSEPVQPQVNHEERIKTLRKELFSQDQDLSNLDYVSKALELRKHILETTGQDVFVGGACNKAPTAADLEKAEHLANGLQAAVDVAEGNNEVFLNELQRKMIDTGPRR